MTIKGVDVSAINGKLDWKKLAKAGDIQFAILRLGTGIMRAGKDLYFEMNYDGCRKAKLQVGAYWYSTATNVEAAEREARNALKLIEHRELDLPIYIMIDTDEALSLSQYELTAIAKRFCDTIETAGYSSGVYMKPSIAECKLSREFLKTYWFWFPNEFGKNYFGMRRSAIARVNTVTDGSTKLKGCSNEIRLDLYSPVK